VPGSRSLVQPGGKSASGCSTLYACQAVVPDASECGTHPNGLIGEHGSICRRRRGSSVSALAYASPSPCDTLHMCVRVCPCGESSTHPNGDDDHDTGYCQRRQRDEQGLPPGEQAAFLLGVCVRCPSITQAKSQ
jgi:hypothetical protein